jgi:hypothetical protein
MQKRGSERCCPVLVSGELQADLDYNDVLCLQAFLALRNVELYALAFFQIAISIANDGVVMDKYIFAFCALNESVAFATIEPLDRTLFFLGHDLELLSF